VVLPELPIAGPSGSLAERADAARNRERILKVASDLVACRGIDAISMQDIAKAAAVGTGTVYRRFGDRAGLALALLDAETRRFQEELLRGDPPLGPGAAPAERLAAFGVRYLELLDAHAPLILAAEPPHGDGRGPLAFYLTHLAVLIGEARPGLDAEHTARMLFAGLGPREHLLMRTRLDWTLERRQAGWVGLVSALAG
jgi:AcrR family transcriptional regulator